MAYQVDNFMNDLKENLGYNRVIKAAGMINDAAAKGDISKDMEYKAWNDVYECLFDNINRIKARGLVDNQKNNKILERAEKTFGLTGVSLYDTIQDLHKNHKDTKFTGMDVVGDMEHPSENSLHLYTDKGRISYFDKNVEKVADRTKYRSSPLRAEKYTRIKGPHGWTIPGKPEHMYSFNARTMKPAKTHDAYDIMKKQAEALKAKKKPRSYSPKRLLGKFYGSKNEYSGLEKTISNTKTTTTRKTVPLVDSSRTIQNPTYKVSDIVRREANKAASKKKTKEPKAASKEDNVIRKPWLFQAPKYALAAGIGMYMTLAPGLYDKNNLTDRIRNAFASTQQLIYKGAKEPVKLNPRTGTVPYDPFKVPDATKKKFEEYEAQERMKNLQMAKAAAAQAQKPKAEKKVTAQKPAAEKKKAVEQKPTAKKKPQVKAETKKADTSVKYSYTRKKDILDDWNAYFNCEKSYSELSDLAKKWFGLGIMEKKEQIYDKANQTIKLTPLPNPKAGLNGFQILYGQRGSKEKPNILQRGESIEQKLTDEQAKNYEEKGVLPFWVGMGKLNKNVYAMVDGFNKIGKDPYCPKVAKKPEAKVEVKQPKEEKQRPPEVAKVISIVQPHTLTDILGESYVIKKGDGVYPGYQTPYLLNGKRGTIATMPIEQVRELLTGMKYRLSKDTASEKGEIPEIRHVFGAPVQTHIYAHENNGTVWREAVSSVVDLPQSKWDVNALKNPRVLVDWLASKTVKVKDAWKHGFWAGVFNKDVKAVADLIPSKRKDSCVDYQIGNGKNWAVRLDQRMNWEQPDMKKLVSIPEFQKDVTDHFGVKPRHMNTYILWRDDKDGVLEKGEIDGLVMTPTYINGGPVNEPVSNQNHENRFRIGVLPGQQDSGPDVEAEPSGPTPSPGIGGGETPGNPGIK